MHPGKNLGGGWIIDDACVQFKKSVIPWQQRSSDRHAFHVKTTCPYAFHVTICAIQNAHIVGTVRITLTVIQTLGLTLAIRTKPQVTMMKRTRTRNATVIVNPPIRAVGVVMVNVDDVVIIGVVMVNVDDVVIIKDSVHVIIKYAR